MSSDVVMPSDYHSSKVRELVAEYCQFERPENRKAFDVHGPYNKVSVLQSAAAERAGCYALYSADGLLRYIGMSEGSVGYRARSHFASKTQASTFWKDVPAVFIDLVEVEHSWEAPSLEAYLILRTSSLSSSVSPASASRS